MFPSTNVLEYANAFSFTTYYYYFQDAGWPGRSHVFPETRAKYAFREGVYNEG